MSLKQRIIDDMKSAMKAGEKRKLGVIRLITAAIKQREVDERIELDDTQVLAVLDKMVKQRRDSLQQYRDAGRDDLTDQEAFEIDVCQVYLPEQLGEAAIVELVTQAIAALGATGMADMGKVMAQVRPQVQGRADMAQVSAVVKSRLAG